MGKKLSVDYLVIGKGFTSDMRQLMQFFSPKYVILDASLPEYMSLRLRKECDDGGAEYHDIREKGALVCRLFNDTRCKHAEPGTFSPPASGRP